LFPGGQQNGILWRSIAEIFFGLNNHGMISRERYTADEITRRSTEQVARRMISLARSLEVEDVNGKYFLDEKAVPSSPALSAFMMGAPPEGWGS
jgi:hypothetical protein